jgi:excisionase family DNA binding protein
MFDDYITVSEAAKLYSREVSVIRRACLNKWIPALKVGSQWVMRKEDAEARWGKK